MKSSKILNRTIDHSPFDFISETPGIKCWFNKKSD